MVVALHQLELLRKQTVGFQKNSDALAFIALAKQLNIIFTV